MCGAGALARDPLSSRAARSRGILWLLEKDDLLICRGALLGRRLLHVFVDAFVGAELVVFLLAPALERKIPRINARDLALAHYDLAESLLPQRHHAAVEPHHFAVPEGVQDAVNRLQRDFLA